MPFLYFKKVTMMPANTGGGVQEELMKLAKNSNKENDIILLWYQYFFAFMCYFACISKQTHNKIAKTGFLLREIFFKVCGRQ